METVYRQAFAEVLEVLKFSSQSIVEKIPEKFMSFLTNNKDNNYIVNIDFSKQDWENNVKPETQAILALIYRDYIVSPEKRRELIKEEAKEQKRIENEIREKYNPDSLFKDKKEETIIKNTNLPTEIKQETFLKKLISFFKKTN